MSPASATVSTLLARANDALNVNPPQGARHLTTKGSDWLWAVTAVFLISYLAHALLSLKPHRGERIFHHIFTVALLAGTLAYFAMASDLGSIAVRTSHNTSNYGSYQVFWPKYAYWAVSFPAVVLALGLLSGLAWATVLHGIGLAWLWVFAYLLSALTSTRYKWGFFALGFIAHVALLILTLTSGLRGARSLGVGRDYIIVAGWANLLWLLYPIAFGLSDGGNVIGVSDAFIFFGILDLLMIPVLAFLFLVMVRRWDYAAMNLQFTQHGRVTGTHPVGKTRAPGAGGVVSPAAV